MPVTTQMASIAAGQSLSAAIDCTMASPVRILMPADWQGEGSDLITFQLSHDNIAFYDVFRHDGSELVMKVVPGTAVLLTGDIGLKTAQWLKFRAGTRQAPAEQTAQRDFAVVLDSAAVETYPVASAARRKTPRKTAKPRRRR